MSKIFSESGDLSTPKTGPGNRKDVRPKKYKTNDSSSELGCHFLQGTPPPGTNKGTSNSGKHTPSEPNNSYLEGADRQVENTKRYTPSGSNSNLEDVLMQVENTRANTPSGSNSNLEDLMQVENTKIYALSGPDRNLENRQLISFHVFIFIINISFLLQTRCIHQYLKGLKTPTDEAFKNAVLKELAMLNIKVNTLFDNVTTLINIQSLYQHSQTIQANALQSDKLRYFSDSLPLKNEEELEKLEEWLNDATNYNLAATEYKRIGGNSAPQAIRNILYRTYSNDLATKFSWDGHKQKAALKTKKTAQCILDAIKQQYISMSESDIFTVIKIWLVKAKERVKRETLEKA